LKDPKKKLFGLILNGGLSRRMGSDKSKKMISKKSLISLVFERAKAQVDYLAINSNQKPFDKKIEIIPDCFSGNLGPLVGVLSGLKWLKKNNDSFSNWLVIFPVDSPFFPENLVHCFFENLKDEKIVMAKCKERLHPVFSMWHTDNLKLLEKFLMEGGRKIDLFSKKIKTRVVNFPFIGYDPFFNVNNLDDLIKAEGIFKKLGGTNL
jgi:molybdopterin-guanine dinucleotide biosynthesis protein A